MYELLAATYRAYVGFDKAPLRLRSCSACNACPGCKGPTIRGVGSLQYFFMQTSGLLLRHLDYVTIIPNPYYLPYIHIVVTQYPRLWGFTCDLDYLRHFGWSTFFFQGKVLEDELCACLASDSSISAAYAVCICLEALLHCSFIGQENSVEYKLPGTVE